MLIMNKIHINEGSKTAALFYFDAAEINKFNSANGFTRTGKYNVRSNHCEMFKLSALISAVLNEKSVVLRFNDRHQKQPRSVRLTLNDNSQIDSIADLLEITLGQGLRVREHFANISIKQIIKNKD